MKTRTNFSKSFKDYTDILTKSHGQDAAAFRAPKLMRNLKAPNLKNSNYCSSYSEDSKNTFSSSQYNNNKNSNNNYSNNNKNNNNNKFAVIASNIDKLPISNPSISSPSHDLLQDDDFDLIELSYQISPNYQTKTSTNSSGLQTHESTPVINARCKGLISPIQCNSSPISIHLEETPTESLIKNNFRDNSPPISVRKRSRANFIIDSEDEEYDKFTENSKPAKTTTIFIGSDNYQSSNSSLKTINQTVLMKNYQLMAQICNQLTSIYYPEEGVFLKSISSENNAELLKKRIDLLKDYQNHHDLSSSILKLDFIPSEEVFNQLLSRSSISSNNSLKRELVEDFATNKHPPVKRFDDKMTPAKFKEDTKRTISVLSPIRDVDNSKSNIQCINLSDEEDGFYISPLSTIKNNNVSIPTTAPIDIDEYDSVEFDPFDNEDFDTHLQTQASTCSQANKRLSGSKNLLNEILAGDRSMININFNESFCNGSTFGDTSRDYSMLNRKNSLKIDEEPKFFGIYQNDGKDPILKKRDHPHSKQMFEVFKKVFKLQSFRQNQFEAINAALLGYDVFVLMPTGGGKSLCYQLPALVSSGISVVVSPLKSLIQDQMLKMNERMPNSAVALTGELDSDSVRQIYSDLRSNNSDIRLLFITPEKISASDSLNSIFADMNRQGRLARFVIDEAHCVSQWGHDFRPDYKKLSCLRQKYSNVPIIALTATATQKVRIDIASQLGLKNAKWFMQSFNRGNLKMEVRPKTKKLFDEMVALIKQEFSNKTGIIYCLSKKECDDLADQLNGVGVQARAYHAGLQDEQRAKIQDDWIKGKYKVVVATIAFGMGIDKSDVRYVIHNSLPKSLEGYYQEVGRAGRDGELSHCILYYSANDFQRWKSLMTKSTHNQTQKKLVISYLYDVQQFCMNQAECRRKQLLKYFGETYDERLCMANIESVCDNCLLRDNFKQEDFTQIVKTILQCIEKMVGEYGRERDNDISAVMLTNIIADAKDPKINNFHRTQPMYGICKHIKKADTTRLVQNLLAKKFLAEDTILSKHNVFASSSFIKLGEAAKDILVKNSTFMFSISIKGAKNPLTGSSTSRNVALFDDDENAAKSYDSFTSATNFHRKTNYSKAGQIKKKLTPKGRRSISKFFTSKTNSVRRRVPKGNNNIQTVKTVKVSNNDWICLE